MDIKNKSTVKSAILLLIGFLVGMMVCALISIIIIIAKKDKNDTYLEHFGIEENADVPSTLEQMLNEEGFLIETPIVNLYYPAKWKEYVCVNLINGEVYTIQFLADIKDNENIPLFDIMLGGSEGTTVGYLRQENGNKISVNILTYDIGVNENWSDEELNILYTMSEDINYIIGMLQKEDSFEILS